MKRARSWYRRLDLSPSATLGLLIMMAFVLIAVIGPFVAPHSPTAKHLDRIWEGPSFAHWFGTDSDGVDVLSQMLYGARLALIISVTVTGISAILGTAAGLVAGYYRSWVDELIMRVVDILLSFPGILLNIAVVAVVARPGVGVLILALTLNGWVGYARLVRGQVLSLREREFVHAARSIGANGPRIMFRYLLPNLMSLIFVKMSFAVGGVILVEAALSFLGLGPQVNYSWGALLDQGRIYAPYGPRVALIPGITIMLIVLGANLLGDGLRDRFDPKREVKF